MFKLIIDKQKCKFWSKWEKKNIEKNDSEIILIIVTLKT